jgi:Tfp pilus assembly protein FimV
MPDSPDPREADAQAADEIAVDETPDWVTDVALAEEPFVFDNLVPDDDDDDDDDSVGVPFSLDDLLIDQTPTPTTGRWLRFTLRATTGRCP